MNKQVTEVKLGDYVVGKGFVVSISQCAPGNRWITFSDADGATISIKVFEDVDIVTVEEFSNI